MNKCGNCYFCDDKTVLNAVEDGIDIIKSRCKLNLGEWVDREDICEFYIEREQKETVQ